MTKKERTSPFVVFRARLAGSATQRWIYSPLMDPSLCLLCRPHPQPTSMPVSNAAILAFVIVGVHSEHVSIKRSVTAIVFLPFF